ncbi:hypothetical protein ACFL0J_03570 [Candidatus Neomarinimicrobiota bacterium]
MMSSCWFESGPGYYRKLLLIVIAFWIYFTSAIFIICAEIAKLLDERLFGLTIPDILLLDIEPNTNDIILEFDVPLEAGNELTPKTGDTKWINYTATLGAPKSITAHIESPFNIPGLNLELVVGNASRVEAELRELPQAQSIFQQLHR